MTPNISLHKDSRQPDHAASRPDICAVVVTYEPDDNFSTRLEEISGQCDYVIIVDNSPGSGRGLGACGERKNVEVLPQTRNTGLACALNTGVARAIVLGFEWVVTFDQDSTPTDGMVDALWDTYQCSNNREKVALVGPRLREENCPGEDASHRWIIQNPHCRLMFERVACERSDLTCVTFVITSGALMNLHLGRAIGPMQEGLFIDYIDHDYCLRARQLGYDILVSSKAVLIHNLGAKREINVAGKVVRPTFHSPLRLRYMSRNRWTLLRRYALVFPHWAAFDLIYSSYNLIRVLLFEDQRGRKLRAIIIGTIDGLCGKQGPII